MLSVCYLMAILATNQAKCSTSVLTDCSLRIPSGKPFAFKIQAPHTVYCQSQHARRNRRMEGSAYFENALKRNNRHPHSPRDNPLLVGTFSPFFSQIFLFASRNPGSVPSLLHRAAWLSQRLSGATAQLLRELVEHERPTPNLGPGHANPPSASVRPSTLRFQPCEGKYKSDMGLP